MIDISEIWTISEMYICKSWKSWKFFPYNLVASYVMGYNSDYFHKHEPYLRDSLLVGLCVEHDNYSVYEHIQT